MHQVMLAEVSEDDLRDIVRTVKQCAREGDMAAAKMVLAYCIGRPTAAVDPDRLDVQEVQLYQEQAVDAAALQTALQGVPAAVAAFLMGTGIDIAGRKLTQQFAQQFQERFPDDVARAAAPDETGPATPQAEATRAKAPEQDRPAGGKPGRREKEKPRKPAAPHEAKVLPLEEIVNAPRTVLAELGLPVSPLTATDSKRELTERQCANQGRSAPTGLPPDGREGAPSEGGLAGGGR
jgi:hypothetical protein